MGKWLILILIMAIARENGVIIPDYIWHFAIAITILGSLAIIVTSIEERKK